jgi:hypothetical protein
LPNLSGLRDFFFSTKFLQNVLQAKKEVRHWRTFFIPPPKKRKRFPFLKKIVLTEKTKNFKN